MIHLFNIDMRVPRRLWPRHMAWQNEICPALVACVSKRMQPRGFISQLTRSSEKGSREEWKELFMIQNMENVNRYNQESRDIELDTVVQHPTKVMWPEIQV